MTFYPYYHSIRHNTMVNEFHPVVEPTKRSKLWGWPDALRLKGSVLPHVTLPVTFIFFWALTMSIIHEKFGVKLELSNSVGEYISMPSPS